MQARSDRSTWAESLRRLKLDGFAACLLEAGGPLTIPRAQALYTSQPLIRAKNLHSLAQILEEDDQTQRFARYLRGEESLYWHLAYLFWRLFFCWHSHFGAPGRLVFYVPLMPMNA